MTTKKSITVEYIADIPQIGSVRIEVNTPSAIHDMVAWILTHPMEAHDLLDKVNTIKAIPHEEDLQNFLD